MSAALAEVEAHLTDVLTRASALTDPDRYAGADESLIPVDDALAGLLPYGGLRRGTVVGVQRSMAALVALLGRASAQGAWIAAVGLPTIGVLAARDAGLDVERFALVPDPGPAWPEATAALLDAVDIVVLQPPPHCTPSDARRIDIRVRDRRAVLVAYGEWPSASVAITPTSRQWSGVGEGVGRLRGYEIALTSRGRGAAARPRHAVLRVGTTPDQIG